MRQGNAGSKMCGRVIDMYTTCRIPNTAPIITNHEFGQCASKIAGKRKAIVMSLCTSKRLTYLFDLVARTQSPACDHFDKKSKGNCRFLNYPSTKPSVLTFVV